MKIEEAYSAYCDVETGAALEYERFWLDRCKQEGINLVASPAAGVWPYCALEAQVGPHKVMFTAPQPKKREGVYFYVQIPNPYRAGTFMWRACKVKSERGFDRLLHRLSYPVFK